MYSFKVYFLNFIIDRAFVIISPNQSPINISKTVIWTISNETRHMTSSAEDTWHTSSRRHQQATRT